MSEKSQEHYTFADENNRHVKIQIAVSRVLEASPIKHTGTREEAVNAIINKIQQTHTLRVSDRGWVVAEDRSGAPADLQKLVTDVLLLEKGIADPDSVAQAVREGNIELGAKSELTTAKQKSDFVARFGYDAWAKLPQRREVPITNNFDNMTAAELKRAPMSVKIRMTEKQISNALLRK